MAKRFSGLAILMISAGVCFGTPPPAEAIKTSKNIAVICAEEPILTGQKTGITIFSQDGWTEEKPGFDLDILVQNAIKAGLNREVRLFAGKDVGVKIGASEGDPFNKELKAKLAELGKEWAADYVVVVYSTKTDDFIQRNEFRTVSGIGHYYAHFDCAYCVFRAAALECKTGKLYQTPVVRRARELYGIEWHINWHEYTSDEQRSFLRILTMLLNETMPEVLAAAGLNDTWKPAPEHFTLVHDARKSIVPEGNELEIPPGISRENAQNAVVAGFKDRNWVIESESADRVIGTYKSKNKEARCTATLSATKITLAPEGYETKKDGNRVQVEVYKRWHNNLKESIAGFLLKAPAAEAAPGALKQ
jgi:hypothetical protein